MSANMVEVRDLSVRFPVKGGFGAHRKSVRAVNCVSLEIPRGKIIGLAGESGSGKTTIGKAILRLIEPSSGSVRIDGRDILKDKSNPKALRAQSQIIFQDPLSSLNPHKTILQILETPLRVHGMAVRESEIEKTLSDVGLNQEVLARYPHEFSGGQLQRICIARALLLRPKFLVCDEAVASLDVSIQSQIINLFKKLRDEYDLTYLFISHNIALLKYLCDAIGVMYLGELVEYSDAETLFENPMHPYTQALFRAIPVPDPASERSRAEQKGLEGEVPSPLNPPPGCAFSTRCPMAREICRTRAPEMREVCSGHRLKCWLNVEQEEKNG